MSCGKGARCTIPAQISTGNNTQKDVVHCPTISAALQKSCPVLKHRHDDLCVLSLTQDIELKQAKEIKKKRIHLLPQETPKTTSSFSGGAADSGLLQTFEGCSCGGKQVILTFQFSSSPAAFNF